MNRDGIDAARAAEKVAAQMSLGKKQQLADIVIDNSGSPEETKKQVDLDPADLHPPSCAAASNSLLWFPALPTA